MIKVVRHRFQTKENEVDDGQNQNVRQQNQKHRRVVLANRSGTYRLNRIRRLILRQRVSPVHFQRQR